ncbi:MAG: hypothetical protein LUQ25_02860 [Methanoregulaceae archaeon]|nr:hypothetical protein [Methanoregulaceae archaeon]
MADKGDIIRELGEDELLLPTLVNAALSANDRIKYYFTLLQIAREQADHPTRDYPNLRIEREAAGEEHAELDSVVSGTEARGEGLYRIPHSQAVFSAMLSCIDAMIVPFQNQHTVQAREFLQRRETLLGQFPQEGDLVEGGLIERLSAGDSVVGDSLHLLVMDLHKALNALQVELSHETIGGARTYLLGDNDRPLVTAFMEGLNRTAPLKFEHPGLGTTATRSNRKLVIQNDIGVTDAHILVITVEDQTATITYTDIHMGRLQFFQSMFDGWEVKWDDTLSRRGVEGFEKEIYHLTVGRYSAGSPEDLSKFLTHLGSRIVFLIDWNRARKRLRNFLLNRDAILVLKWAADNEVGHIAFLNLGGERIVYEALELAAKVPLRYGEPLYQILGPEETRGYLEWVLKTAAQGLLAGQSRLLVQDEIKVEMMRYFRSAHEELMEICEEHATLMIEVGTAVRDALIHIQRDGDTEYAARSAKRAKIWESEADELVSRVRMLARRIEPAEFFIEFLTKADDAVDYLEEASFYTTLIIPGLGSRTINNELIQMADLALQASERYLKALIATQFIYKGYSRDEMQDFLSAVDRVVSLERECDEALRKAEKTILVSSTDYKELWVSFQLAQFIEESTNSLMRTVYIMRDTIFERMNR